MRLLADKTRVKNHCDRTKRLRLRALTGEFLRRAPAQPGRRTFSSARPVDQLALQFQQAWLWTSATAPAVTWDFQGATLVAFTSQNVDRVITAPLGIFALSVALGWSESLASQVCHGDAEAQRVSVPDLCACGRFAKASTSGLSLTSKVRLKADATFF